MGAGPQLNAMPAMPATPTAPPAGGAARFPAWSALGAAPAKPSDFASDLAHLMALLTQGVATSADSELPTLADVAPATASDDATGQSDAVASLWAELGLALPRNVAPVAVNDADGGTRTCAAATPAAPASGATLPLAPAANGTVVDDAAALDPSSVAIAADDSSPDALAVPVRAAGDAPAPINLASLAAFAPAEPVRHGAAVSPHAVVNVQQPQAPQQIAETVAWHVGKGVSEVQIRLNPEDLGPLDIQLKLDGDKVSVRFDMADASVRDVVQTSLPNLASLLSARGLQLDQAQVFSQGRGQGGAPQTPQFQQDPRGDGRNEIQAAPVARPVIRRGLLDDYA